MALDIGAVMDGIAARLETVTGLRVYPEPADSVSVPGAVVGLPEEVEYDLTMRRGEDRATLDLWVLVGRASDRAAAAELAAYMSGTGTNSIKAAIEGDKTLGGVADTVRVTTARSEEFNAGGIDYIGAVFKIDVIA